MNLLKEIKIKTFENKESPSLKIPEYELKKGFCCKVEFII